MRAACQREPDEGVAKLGMLAGVSDPLLELLAARGGYRGECRGDEGCGHDQGAVGTTPRVRAAIAMVPRVCQGKQDDDGMDDERVEWDAVAQVEHGAPQNECGPSRDSGPGARGPTTRGCRVVRSLVGGRLGR